jgi:hypothetical protein
MFRTQECTWNYPPKSRNRSFNAGFEILLRKVGQPAIEHQVGAAWGGRSQATVDIRIREDRLVSPLRGREHYDSALCLTVCKLVIERLLKLVDQKGILQWVDIVNVGPILLVGIASKES